MEQKYKYFAFISYSSKDYKWGRCIQNKLEHYRMPATLCSQHGWDRYPIKPVFFAPTDIQPGGLNAELQERLKASKNLIVVCSPHSAQSKWVGQEIEYFHKLGRTDNIHFFIIDGVPNSGNVQTECYNSIVNELGLPEILGANIHEKVYRWSWLNRERAYVQLITKLLGVEFDSVWQRHRRLLIQRVFGWIIALFIMLTSMIYLWVYNMPIDVILSVKEQIKNQNLPPLRNAVVTMYLENETKTDTIQTVNTHLFFHHIPRYCLGKDVRVKIECEDFLSLDTSMVLSQAMIIPMKRNGEVYGNVRFGIWNPHTEKLIANINIKVDGTTVKSDSKGIVSLYIPIERQKTKYLLSADVPLKDTVINMPCGKNDVIITR